MRKIEGFPHLPFIPSPFASPSASDLTCRTSYQIPGTMYPDVCLFQCFWLAIFDSLEVGCENAFPRFLYYISYTRYMFSPMWRRLPSETWAYCCFTAAFAILRPSERQREHVGHYYCTTFCWLERIGQNFNIIRSDKMSISSYQTKCQDSHTRKHFSFLENGSKHWGIAHFAASTGHDWSNCDIRTYQVQQ